MIRDFQAGHDALVWNTRQLHKLICLQPANSFGVFDDSVRSSVVLCRSAAHSAARILQLHDGFTEAITFFHTVPVRNWKDLNSPVKTSVMVGCGRAGEGGAADVQGLAGPEQGVLLLGVLQPRLRPGRQGRPVAAQLPVSPALCSCAPPPMPRPAVVLILGAAPGSFAALSRCGWPDPISCSHLHCTALHRTSLHFTLCSPPCQAR